MERGAMEAGVARILVRQDSCHAGMAIVVGRRHVLTCAHVLNVAVGRPEETRAPPPSGKIGVSFPFSMREEPIEGKVVPEAWHPVGPEPIADIAILELEEDIPEDVGITIFAQVHRAIEKDPLSVYGIAAEATTGSRVPATLSGHAGAGEIQIDATNGAEGLFIEPGFSGAAVWDALHEAVIGMTTKKRKGIDQAYMVPTSILREAWSALPVEERRLPASINRLWTGACGLLLLLMLTALVWNRVQNEQVAAFFGMHFYAIIAPLIGWIWLRYVDDFPLHGWTSRIPRFANLRMNPGSPAEKCFWIASVFFFLLLPLYIQGHFLKTFHTGGRVYIYPSDFGFTDMELEKHGVCLRGRGSIKCEHPDAGRYSTVTPWPPAKGRYWDNGYHYGDQAWERGTTVTFFPILQPIVILGLTVLALTLYALALRRTFLGLRGSRQNQGDKHARDT